MFGVSAEDAVNASLAAAHATQETVNAFTSIDDEGARESARAIDSQIAVGRYAGPIGGKPIALKDLIDKKGQITTAGSAFYRHQATRSARCVSALESAGGVIIGRTGLHEFAFGFSSENPHFGAVRNPWDLNTSPGGSSGGSAAAVAAGVAPIAVGTDTGGSVRVPAALCGAFGLKVTYGSISLEGVFPLAPSIDTVGPIADSMEHIEVAYRAMSGDDRRATIGQLRIGVPQPWFDDSPTSNDVSAAFQSALEALRDSGHSVEPLMMPEVWPTRRITHAVAREVTEIHRDYRAKGQPYGDDVAARLEEVAQVSESQQREALTWQQDLRDRFAEAFTGVDLLVTPTVPVRAKVIGVDEIDGKHHRSVLSYFTALVNHSLHPALAIPLARSGEPPASIQVIGDRNAEPLLIEFGRSLEAQEIAAFQLAPPN